jgi:Flp pilus assembly pilin Flp
MKTRWLLYSLLEYTCLAVMVACGMIALMQSSFYSWVQVHLTTINPFMGSYLSSILAVLFLAFGMVQIGLRRKGSGALFIMLLIISLPSLLAFDSIDLFKIFGGSLKITTHLSFAAVVVLELLLFLGYLLLSSLTVFRSSRLNMEKRQVLPEEVQDIQKTSYNYLFLITGLALSMAIILVGISAAVEDLIAANVLSFNWYLVIIGMICILVLSAYLYWLGTGKSKAK